MGQPTEVSAKSNVKFAKIDNSVFDPEPDSELDSKTETPREKIQRQRRERHEQSEKTWAYVQENDARYAAHRANISKHKNIDLGDFNLEEVLAHPELDAVKPVKIDPVSMEADDIDSFMKEGEEFVKNPTLAGAASMAVIAIPGKYADNIVDALPLKKIADELPLKKLDKAMAKYLHTMKRFKVPCFEPGPTIKGKFKGKERELESHFARQLKHQEAGINDLTVGEYIENRNRYKKMKRAGTGMAQGDFREDFSTDLEVSLNKSYRKKMTKAEAKQAAKKRTLEIMNNLAALHDPDMIAGGADKVSRMGNRRVNSSIGSLWRRKSRLIQMDEQAQRALEMLGPDAKMNVSLERCPLRGKK